MTAELTVGPGDLADPATTKQRSPTVMAAIGDVIDNLRMSLNAI